jgi:molybdenum cofactor biosynthesis protein B
VTAADEHRAHAPAPSAVRVALVTASDSRTEADNEGGLLLRSLADEAGLKVISEQLLRENPVLLREAVAALASGGAVDAVLVIGKPASPRAIARPTPRARCPAPPVEGFGELFRCCRSRDRPGRDAVARGRGRRARAVFCCPSLAPNGWPARLIIPGCRTRWPARRSSHSRRTVTVTSTPHRRPRAHHDR